LRPRRRRRRQSSLGEMQETARQAAAKEAARVEAEREEERREAARLAAELAAAAEEAARLAAEKAPPPDVSDEERARIRAREAAAKILATMPPTKLDRLEMCHDLFDCVDRNGNGRIDYEEFLAQYPDEVIERWPPQMHQQMALNFRRIDRDGDSSIQRDEFVAWRLEDTMAEDDETFVERYRTMLDRFADLKAQKEARDLARKVAALSAAQQAAKRLAEEKRIVEEAQLEDMEISRALEKAKGLAEKAAKERE